MRFRPGLKAPAVAIALVGASCSSSLEGSGTGGSSGTAGVGQAAGSAGTGTAGASGIAGSGGAAGAGTGGTPEVIPDLRGLAYGNGTFVAVGSELRTEWRGVIYSSTDAITWVRSASDLPSSPNDVEFGNGTFVVVANQYVAASAAFTSNAFVSPDGQTWTARDIPQLAALGFAFGGGSFVAAAAQSHLRSTDGVNWSAFGPAHDGFLSGGVEFAGGRFVSWARGVAAVSVFDGSAWSSVVPVADGNYLVDDLRPINDRFAGTARYDCCAGEVPSAIRWGQVSSADALTWTATTMLTASPPQVVLDDGSVCIAFQGFDVLGGDSCDSLEVTYHDDQLRAEAALKGGGVYVVSGMDGLLTSRDGRAWTKRIKR